MKHGLVVSAGIVLMYFGLIFAASELGGEVVTLLRPSADGNFDEVRIWFTEADSDAFIEHGSDGDWWLERLKAGGLLSLRRAGLKVDYHAVSAPDLHTRYHELRREKYGIADQIIEQLSFSSVNTCDGVVVRLQRPGFSGT
ncbi:MAG: hypothetical protein HOM69_06520 [Gammaproteobacteria bacterium]|nr:hypothetical protein [Gammaproteobacteria bacterium]